MRRQVTLGIHLNIRASQVVHWERLLLPMQETQEIGLIPGLGRSPGGGNDNLLQYSCLENSMDSGVWWTTVHRVIESDMTEHE